MHRGTRRGVCKQPSCKGIGSLCCSHVPALHAVCTCRVLAGSSTKTCGHSPRNDVFFSFWIRNVFCFFPKPPYVRVLRSHVSSAFKITPLPLHFLPQAEVQLFSWDQGEVQGLEQ